MKRFWINNIITTCFVFLLLYAANGLTQLNLFTAFDAVGQALKDFELTDVIVSRSLGENKIDTTYRIVLVNISTLSRREIAEQIQILSRYKPKVIGFDGFFNCEGGLRDSVNCPQLLDTLGNLLLSNAIREAGNVVLASKLMQTVNLRKIDTNDADSLEVSDPIFDQYARRGYVTLPTEATYQEDVKICRSVFPSRVIDGKKELAWSVRLAMSFDSLKAVKFLARNKEEELINFKGNLEVIRLATESTKDTLTSTTFSMPMFYAIDYDQLFREEVAPSLIEGSIVMMGYMGDELGDSAWEDKFFTPLNKKPAGRANPDMFGLVVHANAVAMILSEDYIDEMPPWVATAVAVLVCMITVALFGWMDRNLPAWFDALSALFQIILLLVIGTATLLAFEYANLKMDLTIAVGISALVGPAYDFFKSLQNEYNKRFTKHPPNVSTP